VKKLKDLVEFYILCKKNLINMKVKGVYYPFIFAIYSILFLFVHNIDQLYFFELLLPLAIAIFFTSILLFFSYLVFRNLHKAGMVTFIFLLLFFLYGRVFDAVRSYRIANLVIGSHFCLLSCWGIFFIAGVYFIKKIKWQIYFAKIFNFFTIFLLGILILNIGYSKLKNDFNIWGNAEKNTIEKNLPIVKDNEFKRNIYYIILDGYANSNILKEVYSYDNSSFLDYLDQKGFYIASNSRSNYATTFLSLASSLNMKYVNYLSDEVGKNSTDRSIPYDMIKRNKVMQFLKLNGYRFVHFSSGWGATDFNKQAEVNIRCGKGNEFYSILVKTTILSVFEKSFNFLKTDARNRILCTFSKLSNLEKVEKPTFVFAHIISPHPPYLFGPNGEIILDSEFSLSGNTWSEKEAYINQLIYVNKLVKKFLDKVLSQSKFPPIIVIQADHGTASSFVNKDDAGAYNNFNKGNFKERMGILNIYYFPDKEYSALYDSITPVNSFKIIMNQYFNTDYSLLDDKCYFSNYDFPYNFFDVTDKVKNFD